ncbi:MAG: hypothetical protein AAB831_02035 [Patescibacteria group bacterium]
MPLKRNAMDTLEGIARGTETLGDLFIALKDEADPFTAVSGYRESVEETLKSLDERMCLIMRDLNDRTTWANRMRGCHRMMRIITMNLAVWGKPEWNWEEVAEAMGFLRAVTEGAEMTLMINKPEASENATAP